MSRPPFLCVRLEDRTLPSSYQDAPVLPVLDGPMQVHLQQVAARGRHLGNRADAFAKVGDSNTAYPEFVTALGAAGYNPAASGLSDRPDLVATWAAYHGTSADGRTDSFARDSIGDDAGWSSDRLRGNVAAEVAAIRPAVAVVMIGTNDVGNFNDLTLFRDNLTLVVRGLLDGGVIPVVSTIPDLLVNPVFAGRIPGYNRVVAEVAAAEDVPLWNFWRQLTTLPNHGLRSDNTHLSISPNGSGKLGGADLGYGANLRNRTVLEVLTKVRSVVFADGPADDDTPPTPTAWTPVKPGQKLLAVGSGPGRGTEVVVYDADTRELLSRFVPFEPTFRGGVAPAVGDVDADGIVDIVVGPGPGGGPVVRAFSGADGRLIRGWFAYEDTFRGGVVPAVGDVDADGTADVVVGSGPGGGPRVRVFAGSNGEVLADFFAYESSFRDGVNVAVAGGRVITGSGVGGGPLVATFDPLTGRRLSADFAFDSSLRGGVSVAAGDVTGDGIVDLVAGAGPGAGPLVRVFDSALGRWTDRGFPFDPSSRAGVRVTVAGRTVASGQGWLAGSAVRVADGDALSPFGDFRGGVFFC